MTQTQDMVKYDTAHGPITLTAQDVKQFICPKATDAEVGIFLRKCQYLKLNPFLQQIYLIKYDDKALAATVISKHAYIGIAQKQPDFLGLISGVIVLRGDKVVERQSSFYVEGEQLVGGWARIRKRGLTEPIEARLNLKEFNRHQAQWNDKPAVMIQKCAEVAAIRLAFPDLLTGVTTETEAEAIGVATQHTIDDLYGPAKEKVVETDILAQPTAPTGKAEPAGPSERQAYVYVCPEHSVPMERRPNKYKAGEFYFSHKQGDKWHNLNQKESDAVQALVGHGEEAKSPVAGQPETSPLTVKEAWKLHHKRSKEVAGYIDALNAFLGEKGFVKLNPKFFTGNAEWPGGTEPLAQALIEAVQEIKKRKK